LGRLLIGLKARQVSVEEREWLCHPDVGGVVLFSRNYHDRSQLLNLTQSITAIAGRELLICVDHEGGRVQRFRDEFTRLPALASLGDMYIDSVNRALDYSYRHARVMATELLLCGVDMSFAPVLDIKGRSTVIGDRAFAADAAVIIELSQAYIAGMHDAGMVATGKHFPGHGWVRADTHSEDVCDPRPFDEIEQLDLRPFAALSGKLDAIMMAHVLYPQVDSRVAGYSPFWIKAILREKLAFEGTIFSDDLGMFAAKVAGGLVERASHSLEAGCDAVLVCDPADVSQLLSPDKVLFGSSDNALERLKGRFTATRAEVESVGEWRQWKKSMAQLHMNQKHMEQSE